MNFFDTHLQRKKESYDNKKELSKHKVKLFATYPYSQFLPYSSWTDTDLSNNGGDSYENVT